MQTIELILLFTGDDFTTGYASAGLAHEICKQAHPQSVDDLRVLVYGQCPVEEIEVEALRILEDGFNVWQVRKNTDERK